MSTFASRSDPDRMFRMKRLKNRNGNIDGECRYSSDAIAQRMCPKIKLKPKIRKLETEK